MGKKNFYAVRVGRSGPAIYRTWDECKAQVSGHPGSAFQGFVSLPEAEAYLVGAPAPAADGAAKRPKLTGTAAVPSSSTTAAAPPRAANAFSTMMAARPATAGGVQAGELAVFTDGACQGNQNVAVRANPAGWGAVVVDGCTGDPPVGGSAVAELFGPVELDASSPHFLGAEVGSNNTGELTAVCEALRWLTEHEPSRRAAVICYDSEYASNQAQGIHKAHKNVQLSARSKQLLATARQRRAVRFLHVKGHSNHVWNDAADALANRGAIGQRSAVGGDRRVPPPAVSPPPPAATAPPQGGAASVFDGVDDDALAAIDIDAAVAQARQAAHAAEEARRPSIVPFATPAAPSSLGKRPLDG